MAVREIIRIDEELCDGCGLCVPSCAEGAIAMVDGKARLVSEVHCDGLGACLGHCPQGAITLERREAPEFDEAAVAAHLGGGGPEPHAVPTMPVLGLAVPSGGGCPGSSQQVFGPPPGLPGSAPVEGEAPPTALWHWPVQLHLINPGAPFLRESHLLLAADCSAYAVGDFHQRYLAGKALAIACPKLDSNQEVYLEKLVAMIDGAGLERMTVLMMEVPCCGGLAQLVRQALARARRTPPVELVVISSRGAVLERRSLVA